MLQNFQSRRSFHFRFLTASNRSLRYINDTVPISTRRGALPSAVDLAVLVKKSQKYHCWRCLVPGITCRRDIPRRSDVPWPQRIDWLAAAAVVQRALRCHAYVPPVALSVSERESCSALSTSNEVAKRVTECIDRPHNNRRRRLRPCMCPCCQNTALVYTRCKCALRYFVC